MSTTQADIDAIEASKAPLLEHLIELRSRLIKAVAAFLVAFVVCFYFSRHIYNILIYPFVDVVGAANAKLIATHFLEQFFTNMKLSMFGAAVIVARLWVSHFGGMQVQFWLWPVLRTASRSSTALFDSGTRRQERL